MLYIKCPTCRELLADKQKYYERRLVELEQEFSSGKLSAEDYQQAKSNVIVVELKIPKERWCCKQRIIGYVRVVETVL